MNHRHNRPGEFAMRPEWNQKSAPEPPLDRLDQALVATRPTELSAATMDALWASARRELDRIETVRKAGNATSDDRLILADRSRRRRVFAGIGLAQAAVVLIGVGYALTRPIVSTDPGKPALVAHPHPTPPSANPAARPLIEVATGQILHVRIGDDGPHYDFLTEPSVTSTLPDGMSHDIFNEIESMASL